jgi:peptidoglycan/xylan/chitin deacetylase (PgdA/CDA1 family)
MPPSKRCAVCITFDFDAVALWLGSFRSTDSQAMDRGEFGPRVGAPRILRLLEKYNVPSSWFTPGTTAESWPSVTRAIADAGHEIAHHGYAHRPPLDLGDEEESDLVRGIEALEVVVGKRPTGYRAPDWTITDATVGLLIKHGFTYASNGMAQDYEPYLARIGDQHGDAQPFGFGKETRLVEIPSAWHLADYSQLEVGPPWNPLSPPGSVEQIWKDEFDYMHENVHGGVITYVFHPECIGRGHRIMILERLIRYIRDAGDVWFARTEDIARAWRPNAEAASPIVRLD